MAKITKASPGPLAPPEDQEQAPLIAKKKPATKAESAPATAPVAAKKEAAPPSAAPVAATPPPTAPQTDPELSLPPGSSVKVSAPASEAPAAPAAAAPAQPVSGSAATTPRRRTVRKTPTATKVSKAATAPALTVTSVSPIGDINVAKGTLLGAVGLPTTVLVMLSNGVSTSLSVTWNNAGSSVYDGTEAGTYAFAGTLTMPSAAITNPLGLTASAKVIVASSASSGARPTSRRIEVDVESSVEFGKSTPKKGNYKSLAFIGIVLGVVLGMIAVAWFSMRSPLPKSPDYSSLLLNPGRMPVQTNGNTNPPAGTFKAYPSPLAKTVPTDIIDVSSGPAVQRRWTNAGPTGPGVGSQWISVAVSGNSNVFNAPLVVNGTNNQTTEIRPPRQSKPANTGSSSATMTNVVKVEQQTVVIHEPSPPPVVINEAPPPPPMVIIRQPPPPIRVRVWGQPEFDQDSPYRYPPIR